MAFSYTKKKKLSFGNRTAYIYTLTDVATSGSKLYIPFKKITGYIIQTTDNSTSCINVAVNQPSLGHGIGSYLQFAAGEVSNGEILVVGLM